MQIFFFNSISSSVSWFWKSCDIGSIFLDFFSIRSIAAIYGSYQGQAKMPASCVTTDKPNLAQILASMNHAYQGAGEKKFRKCRKLRRFIRGENTKKRKFIKKLLDAPSNVSLVDLCPTKRALTSLIASSMTAFFLMVAAGAFPAATASMDC